MLDAASSAAFRPCGWMVGCEHTRAVGRNQTCHAGKLFDNTESALTNNPETLRAQAGEHACSPAGMPPQRPASAWVRWLQRRCCREPAPGAAAPPPHQHRSAPAQPAARRHRPAMRRNKGRRPFDMAQQFNCCRIRPPCTRPPGIRGCSSATCREAHPLHSCWHADSPPTS